MSRFSDYKHPLGVSQDVGYGHSVKHDYSCGDGGIRSYKRRLSAIEDATETSQEREDGKTKRICSS